MPIEILSAPEAILVPTQSMTDEVHKHTVMLPSGVFAVDVKIPPSAILGIRGKVRLGIAPNHLDARVFYGGTCLVGVQSLGMLIVDVKKFNSTRTESGKLP